MKLYDRKSFLQLPMGTLYRKRNEPFLCLKLGCCTNSEGEPSDWFYVDLSERLAEHARHCSDDDQIKEVAKENGESISTRLGISRDGCFDPEDVFEVWDSEERAELVELLSMTPDQLKEWVG